MLFFLAKILQQIQKSGPKIKGGLNFLRGGSSKNKAIHCKTDTERADRQYANGQYAYSRYAYYPYTYYQYTYYRQNDQKA